jgi:hypothetical protein
MAAPQATGRKALLRHRSTPTGPGSLRPSPYSSRPPLRVAFGRPPAWPRADGHREPASPCTYGGSLLARQDRKLDTPPSDLGYEPADVPRCQPRGGVHNDMHRYRVGLAIHRQHGPVYTLRPATDRDSEVPSQRAVGERVADRLDQLVIGGGSKVNDPRPHALTWRPTGRPRRGARRRTPDFLVQDCKDVAHIVIAVAGWQVEKAIAAAHKSNAVMAVPAAQRACATSTTSASWPLATQAPPFRAVSRSSR